LISGIRCHHDDFWASGDRAWDMPGMALFFTLFVNLFSTDPAVMPIRLA